MSRRTQKKIDYPVCRTTTPHSTWFLDPLCTSESETPRSLYVVPWDRQLQIIPELQEAGRSRSSVHCRPVSLLDSTHTADIKDISIQSRSKIDLHLCLLTSAMKDTTVHSRFNTQVSSGGSGLHVWKLLFHPVAVSSVLVFLARLKMKRCRGDFNTSWLQHQPHRDLNNSSAGNSTQMLQIQNEPLSGELHKQKDPGWAEIFKRFKDLQMVQTAGNAFL